MSSIDITAVMANSWTTTDENRRKYAAKLLQLCIAVGPDEAREKLVPFIADAVDTFLNGEPFMMPRSDSVEPEFNEQGDEILSIIAGQLGSFLDKIGGAQYANLLMEPLIKIATVEETVVRDQAVSSLNNIMSQAGIDATALALVQEHLTRHDWFTGKVSACGLYASILKNTTDAETRTTIIEEFEKLCKDSMPMVRRAAAKNLGDFGVACKGVSMELVLQHAMPMFITLVADNDESVGLMALSQCTKLALLFDSENQKGEHMLQIINSCLENASWKVRNAIAKQYAELSKAMGSNIVESDMVAHLVEVLQDPEAEVRISAVKSLDAMVELVSASSWQEQVVPALQYLAYDRFPLVRSKASEQVMVLAKKNKLEGLHGIVLPLLEVIDEEGGGDGVRLKILAELCDPTVFADFQAALDEQLANTMFNDYMASPEPNWRLRESLIRCLPAILKAFPGQNPAGYFTSQQVGDATSLYDVWIGSLQDQFARVREAGAEVIEGICTALGSDFATGSMLVELKKLYESTDEYLKKISALNACKYIKADGKIMTEAADFILKTSTALADSKTDFNVQLMAIQCLGQETMTTDYKADVSAVLNTMKDSDDPDVAFESARLLGKM